MPNNTTHQSPVSSSLSAGEPSGILSRTDGYSLGSDFYRLDAVFEMEMERIWKQGWLFAGHSCELQNPGSWQTLTVGQDPILLIRGADLQLRAFYNLCRHRGTLLCNGSSGEAKKLVCPYHQWSYDTQGKLTHTLGMQEDLEREKLGLNPIAIQEEAGFIYISLGANPPEFESVRSALRQWVTPQGLNHSKVALQVDYTVRANWKIIWENNRECYHCNANHPQYIRANYDHYNADDTPKRALEAMQIAVEKSESKWKELGLSISHGETGMAAFPDPNGKSWFCVNRTALSEGYLSETMNGRQAAPLMGDYSSPDVGTLRIRSLPNFWNHSSCDHSVSTGFFPINRETTGIRVTWLVNQDAREGKDYQLEDFVPFWKLTSEQDWELCERVQRWVVSSGYIPGPLSTYKEYNLESFFQWYTRVLNKGMGVSNESCQ